MENIHECIRTFRPIVDIFSCTLGKREHILQYPASMTSQTSTCYAQITPDSFAQDALWWIAAAAAAAAASSHSCVA